MSLHLAVYGGMFDPVHKGHVEAARFTLERLQLHSLKMIPCGNPNHRVDATEDSSHRFRMLELATCHDAEIEIDPIEINGAGTSYTTETLAKLNEQEPGARLIFVLGIDSFNSLPQWHQYDSIFQYCSLFVLSRPGESVSVETANLIGLDERKVDTGEELVAAETDKILFTDDFQFDISSTLVRDKLKAGAIVDDVLDQAVLDYIKENGLYSSLDQPHK